MQKEIRIITQEAKETRTGAHSIPGRMAHEQEGSQHLQSAWDEGVSPTPGLPSGRGTDQGRNTEQMVSTDHYQRGLGSVNEVSLDSNCKLVLSVFLISWVMPPALKSSSKLLFSSVFAFPKRPEVRIPENMAAHRQLECPGQVQSGWWLSEEDKQEEPFCQDLWPLGHLHFASAKYRCLTEISNCILR